MSTTEEPCSDQILGDEVFRGESEISLTPVTCSKDNTVLASQCNETSPPQFELPSEQPKSVKKLVKNVIDGVLQSTWLSSSIQ